MLAVVGALLGVPTAAGGAKADAEPVLALVSEGTMSELAYLDALTLEAVPGAPRLPVRLQDIPWAYSPDGSRLAIGSGRSSNLLFVDLGTMTAAGNLDVAFPTALAWPKPSRLLVLERSALEWALVVVDPSVPRVVSRRALGKRGDVASAALTRDGLAVLMMPRQRIGTARLLLLDASGRARRTELRRVAAGSASRRSAELRRIWYRHPALAVDVDAGRAYVVTAGTRVAVIDLSTLAVSYRELRIAQARLAGGSSASGPTRASKGGDTFATGTQRQALWLGDGLLAVSGWRERIVREKGKRVQFDEPAGLSLLDVRDWTSRQVLPQGRWFHATADALLAYAGPAGRRSRALAAFTHQGAPLFRLELDTVSFGVQSAGPYAYLGLGDAYRAHAVTVVDTRTGEAVRRPTIPGWLLLVSPSQPQFCWCYTGTTIG